MKKINLLLITIIMIFNFGCDNNPAIYTDCDGIENGLSVEDNCDICDEDPTNNCTQDCNGTWGGLDQLDECGNCGGNSKLDCSDNCITPNEYGNYVSAGVDCFGTCGGTALVDNCNICNGYGAIYDCGCPGIMRDCANECGGNAVKDCNGDCLGTSFLDECNECSSGKSGHEADSDIDCAGVCFGISYLDECGICDEISFNNCTQDCTGTWGGDAVDDTCGECNGDNSTCNGCDGIANSGLVNDACGVCDGDGSTCTEITNGCEIPENTVHLNASGNVLYNIPTDIGGYQFDVDGATVNSASGGVSASSDFIVSVGGSTILAFSFTGAIIPAGCGTLIVLNTNGNSIGLSNIVFSSSTEAGSEAIEVLYYQP